MKGIRVLIIGTATRTSSRTCVSTARLEFSGPTHRSLDLPDSASAQFQIADFSADGSHVLLGIEHVGDNPDDDDRKFRVANIDISAPVLKPVNVLEAFGWKDCVATIEPEGFIPDGRILIRLRPSIWSGTKRPGCVTDVGLYATDLIRPPARIANNASIPRNGAVADDAFMACKTDPDIVDACFTVRGRLSLWNGTPTARIWHVGTKRILGVSDDYPPPKSLSGKVDWDTEAWGDFDVCPLTKDIPGHMQMVCIESSSRIFEKKR
jgi:hypothetical protein